jgi:hypothetical protein
LHRWFLELKSLKGSFGSFRVTGSYPIAMVGESMVNLDEVQVIFCALTVLSSPLRHSNRSTSTPRLAEIKVAIT